jgi:hypothetical protein
VTKGPRRIVLDQYLDSAAEGVIKNAGRDWKEKADDLQELGDALRQAAQQAELRIGEQTLTGPAMRASMEEMSAAMVTRSAHLRAAGEALRVVGVQIADTREARDSMKDLGDKPAPYQAPAGTPGVELNTDEIQAQADASAARQAERSAWQTAYDKQEARSLALTKDMDAAFLGAIPPMQEIHGQQDPTEPPPDGPSGPGGTYLPGTQAPAPTGGGGGGGGGGGSQGHLVIEDGHLVMEQHHTTTHVQVSDPDPGPGPNPGPKPNPGPTPGPNPAPGPTPGPHPGPTHTGTPSTTVSGTSQSGVTYQGPNAGTSVTSSSGGAPGTPTAALGAAGAAGGASGMAGSIRPGSMPAAGTGSARAIGSTARAGAPGALSRTTGTSSTAARSAGSPSSRGATGSGRGAAGARGAGGGSGSRGTSGARGAGAAGGRGGRKGEREQVSDRDRLVYDQDWLGDDDVAPGVLD